MKTHKEMFEALLAGETLVNNQKTYTSEISLLDNGRLSSIQTNCKLLFDLPLADWRIKQKTININGFEVPEPVRGKLEKGDLYFIPGVLTIEAYDWSDDEIDNNLLKWGLVHLTKEAAELHTKALISFTQRE